MLDPETVEVSGCVEFLMCGCLVLRDWCKRRQLKWETPDEEGLVEFMVNEKNFKWVFGDRTSAPKINSDVNL